MKGTETPSVH